MSFSYHVSIRKKGSPYVSVMDDKGNDVCRVELDAEGNAVADMYYDGKLSKKDKKQVITKSLNLLKG